MKLNFNFESRENHFLTSGISHPGWYLSPRFTVIPVFPVSQHRSELLGKTPMHFLFVFNF